MPGASEVKAGGAYIEIGGDTSKLKSALGSAASLVKGFASGIKGAAGIVVSLGKTMVSAMKAVGSAVFAAARSLKDFAVTNVKRGLVVLGAAVGFATKEFVSFQTAAAEVWTLLGVGAVKMSALSREVLDMSTAFGQAPVDTAKALYQTISAGITDTNDAMKLLGIASKAATAGLTSTFNAVDVITTVMNTYGKTVEEATLISDQMFTAVREGKTTFGELSGTLGTVASLAAQAGLGFEDLMAAIATMTKGGVRTDMAVTSLRATLVSIISPSAEAVDVAKELGIAFNAEALSAFGLPAILRQVKAATKGNVEVMSKLFPNIRALSAVMNLAGTQAKEFQRQLKNMKNASGATDAAFRKMANTAGFKLAQAWSTIRVAFVTFGTFVAPFVVKAAQGVAKAFASLTDWMRKHGKSIKSTLDTAYKFVVRILSDIGDYFIGLGKRVLSGKTSLGDAFAEAIHTALTKVLEKFIEFAPFMVKLGNMMIGSLLEGLSKKDEETDKSVIDMLGELFDLILTSALTVVETNKEKIAEVGRKIVSAILDTFTKADPETGKTIVDRVGTLIGDVIGGLAQVTLDEYENIKKIGVNIYTALIDGFTEKGEGGESAFDKIKKLVEEIGTDLLKLVKDNSATWIQVGKDIGAGILSGLWIVLKEGIGLLGDKMYNFMKNSPTLKFLVDPLGIMEKISPSTPTAGDIGGVNDPLLNPSMATSPGGGSGSNITVNNLFKQDNSDIERLTRDTKRMQRRGRL